MNILSQSKSYKSNIFIRLFARYVAYYFPRRFKRLIFISSVMGVIQQIKDPDMQLIGKLNDLFKVAQYDDAFVFPMYIKSFIWKGIGTTPIEVDASHHLNITQIMAKDLSMSEVNAVGDFFADKVPACLRYGSAKLMASDVIMLIKQLKTFYKEPIHVSV